MSDINMPLWLDLEDEWWEQLMHPDDDSHAAWVNEILDEADEGESDDTDPYWKRGEWRDEDFEPF
ncbi:MAG: hypothetical protein GC179_08730 [Anaerolineaceae bacterium]|nr:hypothetical protein [Anaerolineaceae bacterium]